MTRSSKLQADAQLVFVYGKGSGPMRTPFQTVAAPSADYATPVDDDVNKEPSNQPALVQIYGDDNGHDSDDDAAGTAA